MTILKTVKTTELRDIHSAAALSDGIYRFPLLKHLVVEQFRKSVSNNPTNPFPISNILSRSRRHPPRAIGGLANCSFDTLSPIYCPQWCCSDAPWPTMVQVHRGGYRWVVEVHWCSLPALCGADRPANSNIVLGGATNVHLASHSVH